MCQYKIEEWNINFWEFLLEKKFWWIFGSKIFFVDPQNFFRTWAHMTPINLTIFQYTYQRLLATSVQSLSLKRSYILNRGYFQHFVILWSSRLSGHHRFIDCLAILIEYPILFISLQSKPSRSLIFFNY